MKCQRCKTEGKLCLPNSIRRKKLIAYCLNCHRFFDEQKIWVKEKTQ